MGRLSPWAGKRNERGFTLVELLVVLVILGVLSAVLVFAVRSAADKGQEPGADVKSVRTAQEAFCARFGSYGTETQLAGIDPAPDGQKHRFLSTESTYTDIELGSGGACGPAAAPSSKFTTRVGLPTAVVNIAANTDQWPTADNATLGFTKNGSPPATATGPTAVAPDPFDSVEKIDQLTVDITPKTENLRLPEQIAHPKGAIVPTGRHLDGSTGGLPAGPHNGNDGNATPLVPGTPVGSGPFRWSSYSPGPEGSGSASFTANMGYWVRRRR